MCASYGVSETTICDALRLLAAEGLIETRTRAGTRVRPRPPIATGPRLVRSRRRTPAIRALAGPSTCSTSGSIGSRPTPNWRRCSSARSASGSSHGTSCSTRATRPPRCLSATLAGPTSLAPRSPTRSTSPGRGHRGAARQPRHPGRRDRGIVHDRHVDGVGGGDTTIVDFRIELDELTGVYMNAIRGIVTLVLHCKPSSDTEHTSRKPTAAPPGPHSKRSSTARPRSTRLISWTATAPAYEPTTASTSSQRDKTFPTSSRPAHGAGARRLNGAARLLSSPRLAAPGGALGGCGPEVGRHPLWLGRSAPRL
nr:GntR family transcriptional regulator [Streptomyces sp. SID10362]